VDNSGPISFRLSSGSNGSPTCVDKHVFLHRSLPFIRLQEEINLTLILFKKKEFYFNKNSFFMISPNNVSGGILYVYCGILSPIIN